jgi:hypothetical protein
MIFHKGLIHSNEPFLECAFIPGIEDENVHKSNLLKKPYNWEYRHKTIHYKYNSCGHRSVEIKDLSDDYILFAGCSVTEGVALKLEDTYPNLVAKELNKDYYNLGVGGSSPSVSVKNIIAFLSIVGNKTPAAIVIQWPHFQRYYRIDKFHIQHFHPKQYNNSFYKELLIDNDAFRYNYTERLYLLHFLHNIKYKGKLVQLHWEIPPDLELITDLDHTCNFTNQNIEKLPDTIDHARDLSHPGSETHKLYSQKILDFF